VILRIPALPVKRNLAFNLDSLSWPASGDSVTGRLHAFQAVSLVQEIAQPLVQRPVPAPAALEQVVLWIPRVGFAVEALFRIERGDLRQARIVIHPDVRIGGNFGFIARVELVGQAQEMRVGVALENIHSQHR